MSEKYISVETAVALAMQYCRDDDGTCSKAGHDLRELLDDLENTASADVRPVVPAEWIALDIYRGMGNYKCSVCNQECYVPECMGEPMYIFCPNCGAKMRKEEP